MPSDTYFTNGAVLRFEPFHFTDGGMPKPKYFIVLKVVEDRLVIASLPTSRDAVPNHIDKAHGCIDLPEINFNCYYFCPNKAICENGFSFPLETYVYGFRIAEYEAGILLQQEKLEDTIITQCGILKDIEYKAIIRCLAHSSSVKRKYRKILEM